MSIFNVVYSFIERNMREGKASDVILRHLVAKGASKETVQSIIANIATKLEKQGIATSEKGRQLPTVWGRYVCGVENIILHGNLSTLRVGSFCSFAEGVRVFLGDYHRTDWGTTWHFGHQNTAVFPHHGCGHPISRGDVTIGNDVWIGRAATIMSGVTIGDGAVIAANAHVVKNVGQYEMVGGNPAKLIRRRFKKKQIASLLILKWWDLPVDSIQKLVPYLCSNDIDLAIQKIREIREASLAK